MPDVLTPNFEQTPSPQERLPVNPETGIAFETPASTQEKPSVPVPAVPVPSPVSHVAPRKDSVTLGVEGILEEDLADTYSKMDPVLQAKFRKEGERVTSLIVTMLRSAKLKARETLALITGWLKMIPAVNRFFLIQEAKIKTDKIITLAEEEKRKSGPI